MIVMASTPQSIMALGHLVCPESCPSIIHRHTPYTVPQEGALADRLCVALASYVCGLCSSLGQLIFFSSGNEARLLVEEGDTETDEVMDGLFTVTLSEVWQSGGHAFKVEEARESRPGPCSVAVWINRDGRGAHAWQKLHSRGMARGVVFRRQRPSMRTSRGRTRASTRRYRILICLGGFLIVEMSQHYWPKTVSMSGPALPCSVCLCSNVDGIQCPPDVLSRAPPT